MKFYATAAALCCLGLNSAAAQDWSGAYVGASLGRSVASVDDNYDSEHVFSFDADGTLWGLALGYNLQSGNMVYGVDASLSFGDLAGSGVCDPSSCLGSGTTPTATIDQMALLRARLGFADANRLYYATLGFARANAEVDDPTQGGIDAHQHSGWTAGLGMDWALSEQMTVGAEYVYARFEDIEYALVSTPDVIGFQTQELRLNLKFAF